MFEDDMPYDVSDREIEWRREMDERAEIQDMMEKREKKERDRKRYSPMYHIAMNGHPLVLDNLTGDALAGDQIIPLL